PDAARPRPQLSRPPQSPRLPAAPPHHQRPGGAPMRTSHKVVFTAPRKAELWPSELAEPGPGELLIETSRTLISTGTELTALSGEFPPGSMWARYVHYPWDAGYSNVGTVVAVGPEVDDFEPGERVASMGTHATQVIRRAGPVWTVPERVSDEAGTFAVLAEIVMNGVRRGRIAFGESVAIVGAGLLGQLAAQLCQAAGAWPVILI